MIKTILSFAASSKPTTSKYIAARMIGYLAEFQKEKFDPIVFEKAKQLCFDNDKKIKLIMCDEVLEKIVKVIDKE